MAERNNPIKDMAKYIYVGEDRSAHSDQQLYICIDTQIKASLKYIYLGGNRSAHTGQRLK